MTTWGSLSYKNTSGRHPGQKLGACFVGLLAVFDFSLQDYSMRNPRTRRVCNLVGWDDRNRTGFKRKDGLQAVWLNWQINIQKACGVKENVKKITNSWISDNSSRNSIRVLGRCFRVAFSGLGSSVYVFGGCRLRINRFISSIYKKR